MVIPESRDGVSVARGEDKEREDGELKRHPQHRDRERERRCLFRPVT